ncbi:hypothetical protein ACRAWC_15785 [Leifsonia sp. L25]|uniref:hypothetical protein n=1 Tax=Actinomycetes TaxID=1760 RepID=UPI003D688198
MKTLTKIIVASTTGVLSAGLATAGAFAATGAFSVQDQAGTTIAAHGVTGTATHSVDTAKTAAEQKADTVRGEVSKAVAQASAAPSALPTNIPSVAGTASGSASTGGTASGTSGSVAGSGEAAAAAGTSGLNATGTSTATVVTPPAAVDVRGTASVTAGH